MHYKRILLAINCSGDEKSVVDEALRLRAFFEAELSIVAINDPGAGKAHMMMGTLPKVTREDIVKELKAYGFGQQIGDITITIMQSEKYAEAIAQASNNFDLLIMGHHSKSWMKAFLIDSTDERVADRIECPILLVPLRSK